jgi:LytS/YehU family sensor histidine kinase
MSSMPPLIISALIWKSLQLSKKTEESFELKNKMLQAETKALKAQINPHFLFNSMNNIYSLAQIKSDKTGDAILSLSEILRFITYESDKDKVSLTDELKQIDNFVKLQFLKDDNQDNVSVEISADSEGLQIAPMLLLPFIENCFKHSNFENKVTGWIKINLSVKSGHLILKINNSAVLKPAKKDKTGGVGMENVKRRLALIYPDKHTLSIKQDENSYNVILDLNLTA